MSIDLNLRVSFSSRCCWTSFLTRPSKVTSPQNYSHLHQSLSGTTVGIASYIGKLECYSQEHNIGNRGSLLPNKAVSPTAGLFQKWTGTRRHKGKVLSSGLISLVNQRDDQFLVRHSVWRRHKEQRNEECGSFQKTNKEKKSPWGPGNCSFRFYTSWYRSILSDLSLQMQSIISLLLGRLTSESWAISANWSACQHVALVVKLLNLISENGDNTGFVYDSLFTKKARI